MSVADGATGALAEVSDAGRDADDGRSPPTIASEDIDTARGYADASRASSTRHMYESDWRRFAAWYRGRGLATLPADPRVVAVFLSAEAAAGSAPATVGRRVAAIGWMHRRAGLQPPQQREEAAAILEVLAGIRRTHGQAPERKQAADADVLRDMLRATPGEHLRTVRDRAVLSFGMAAHPAGRSWWRCAWRTCWSCLRVYACWCGARKPTKRAPPSPSQTGKGCSPRCCWRAGWRRPGSPMACCSGD